MPENALIVVDVQNDFCPGGALAVAGGDEIVPGINALMENFDTVILTQDWHPKRHGSFASTHGADPFSTVEMPYGSQVLWPDHCVQGSDGAAFHEDLRTEGDLILRKGCNPAKPMAWPWKDWAIWWSGSGVEAQVVKDVLGHGRCLYLFVDLFDLAFGIDHKGVAHHAHVLAAHELFQSVAVVGRCDGARGHALVFTLGIAEQGEGQAVLLDELGVAFGVVFADAKHADAMGFKGRPLIAEVAGFFGAAWGVVLGIEVQNNLLSAQ